MKKHIIFTIYLICLPIMVYASGIGSSKNACELVDENSVPYGVTHVGNKPRVSSMPYAYDIAEGNVAGHTTFRALGINNDVDSSVEDMWAPGGTYTFPNAPMQMEVTSTSVNDDSGGTGVISIHIHYLDNNYDEAVEEVVLNGTGIVNTVATNILRINHIHTESSGSGKSAAGTIDVRHLSDTPVYGRILLNENIAKQAIWTVPNGKTAFITEWQVGVGHSSGNRYANFQLKTTSDLTEHYHEGIFQTKEIVNIQDGAIFVPLVVPFRVPAKSDIKITVVSDAVSANAFTSGHFAGWYEDE